MAKQGQRRLTDTRLSHNKAKRATGFGECQKLLKSISSSDVETNYICHVVIELVLRLDVSRNDVTTTTVYYVSWNSASRLVG